VTFVSVYIETYGLVERTTFASHLSPAFSLTDGGDNGCEERCATRQKRPLRCAVLDCFLGCTTVFFSAPLDGGVAARPTQARTQVNLSRSLNETLPDEFVTSSLPNLFLRDGCVAMSNLPNVSTLAKLLFMLCWKRPGEHQGVKCETNIDNCCQKSATAFDVHRNVWFEDDLRKTFSVLSLTTEM